VTPQASKLGSGLPWRHGTSRQLGFIRHLDAKFELIVQRLGQTQAVTLIRFHQACRALLHMDALDRHLQLQQVLFKGSLVVACVFEDNIDLWERDKGLETFKE
jgi:hypothetical protein